eukprot:TRINITY_DN2254_c0_g2_i1.p1 TRINITY_DN2254_c0_g2~~TRINITY_DN2254_c0_g2_i1.p1  ORF type:complete len:107 (+),score=5.51 TRINITY_DN2254_c0_g2_i1:56-376(+)
MRTMPTMMPTSMTGWCDHRLVRHKARRRRCDQFTTWIRPCTISFRKRTRKTNDTNLAPRASVKHHNQHYKTCRSHTHQIMMTVLTTETAGTADDGHNDADLNDCMV